MSTVTDEDRVELEKSFADYFASQGEAVSPELVTTLMLVAVGYLRRSLGYLPPIPRDVERGQLAGHLGGIYLQGTRPNPNNNYGGLLLQVAARYLAELNPFPPLPGVVLPILVTLALGATRETDPRATRAGMTVHFIDLYVEGR